ncbi:Protein fantastic four 3 [Rhynchospora pubera]|uniref:Protein fantastic four 3 n=1 Tax=Rhynchospora pubera TaxID=906938 RepID=A0AAV8EYT0_9POAL|nr:Protein fantastic four 3 [Rhynchospora pubera]KAJ4786322.1 Protein fantastic four 3 [Rhynchospora pubera]
MTSYIQTTQFHQERLNLQVLRWVLPVSKREEVSDTLERKTESNGAGWNSLYSISNTKERITPELNGSSAPPLTPISKKTKYGTKNNLDMYTETLGCETGTMYTVDDYKRDGLASDRVGFLTQEEAEERRRERKEMVERRIKRVKTSTEFPPVLTTRTGEKCMNIVRERGNGRMIMYAQKKQSMVTAERRDGRLLLHLSSSSSEEMKEIQEEIERDTREEDERKEGGYLGVVGNEMNGNDNGDDEMEGRKYVFVGRCKEEEKRDNWETFMVASAI